MNMNYYDIESLDNVFTLANYDEKKNHIDIYYLIDDEKLLNEFQLNFSKACDEIYKKNLNFTGTLGFIDIKEEQGMRILSRTFGCSNAYMANNPNNKSDYPDEFRLVCDTDPKYNPETYPYFAGYNSFNYDTTMLALLFDEAWSVLTDYQKMHPEQYQPSQMLTTITFNHDRVTAKKMREHNDNLFNLYKNSMPSYLPMDANGETDYTCNRFLIRRNMLLSGRHLDVARLNEKQQKVALKRLLGMLGYQILESDKLKPTQNTLTTLDELLDLIAYNVSDIVNLKMLFYHPVYQAQFELKQGLLKTYPELIYEKQKNKYAPNISQETVRKDRLNIDSSSAQFATKSLCPYDHIKDMPVVSFDYPAKEKAEKLNIQPVNVLEETKKFFFNLYSEPKFQHIRDRFMKVYNYYKSIEGKNFNDSKGYAIDYPGNAYNIPYKLKDMPKVTDGEGTFMPYFDKDGNPTSCYVIFSTGGVHGAEYNKALYDYDMMLYNQGLEDLAEVKTLYPNPVDLHKAKTVTLSDGREFKATVFLKSGKKVAESEYRNVIVEKPKLASVNTKDMTELNNKYAYTSADEANHEDFKSYYPNLLRMMMAFYNTGLGYDRYAEIFDQKEEFGKLMKDESLSESERDHYRILREGTKLILNSASGAADAVFENNIRANNQIISMRIIGQLFSWRIGQAQAYQGSKVISTNTDGLYSVMEMTLNNQILEKESSDIGVEIEPEPMFLISKDTNNRIELKEKNGKIIGASGGTLGCRKGPNPTKALAHPAIIDWALAEYLIVAASGYKGLSLDKDFDMDIGRSILNHSLNAFEPIQFLLMYQNIVSSSPSSITYIYGTTDSNPDDPIILQHYNRMFIMKENTVNKPTGLNAMIHLHAANAKKITRQTLDKRAKTGDGKQDIAIARNVLMANGVNVDDILANNKDPRDIVTTKVTNIEPTWNILIYNNDLHNINADTFNYIKENLDYEEYLTKVRDSYEKSWRNHVPNTD